MTELESKRVELQSSLDSEKTIESRRKLGQFSTPTILAREIVDYAVKLTTDSIVFLDPAFGMGSFYSALINTGIEIDSARAFEIDPHYYGPSSSFWKEYPIEIDNKDFILEKPNNHYNLLICNPPYIRHHLINTEYKEMMQLMVKKELNINISGLAGMYCYFLLLCHKWLAPGAICAWLIPSEFMDVGYGKALKQYLLEKVSLLRIHRYDPNDVQFDDALVSSVVVWFKNESPNEKSPVIFSFGGTHMLPSVYKEITRDTLRDENKWTRFPTKSERSNDKCTPLSTYFKAKRGIATGNNDFFIMKREKAKEIGIDEKYLVPILPSPRQMKLDCIKSDNVGYPLDIEQLVLLTSEDDLETIKKKSISTYNYLISGVDNVSKQYLCAKRKLWYQQEKREPAPIVCSYMGRGDSNPFRFILNESKALVTNSYLMLYPTDQFKKEFGISKEIMRKTWEYLNSISSTLLDEGRVYGGGLQKIEPKELMNVDVNGLRNYLLN